MRKLVLAVVAMLFGWSSGALATPVQWTAAEPAAVLQPGSGTLGLMLTMPPQLRSPSPARTTENS